MPGRRPRSHVAVRRFGGVGEGRVRGASWSDPSAGAAGSHQPRRLPGRRVGPVIDVSDALITVGPIVVVAARCLATSPTRGCRSMKLTMCSHKLAPAKNEQGTIINVTLAIID
jgi:hypothetical protein